MTRRLGISLCKAIAICSGVAVLPGCFSSAHDELQSWMTEQRNQTKPSITPIAEPRKFVPQTYAASLGVEPFSNQRLTQALKQANKASGANQALVQPEINRRKEALEAVPLDGVTMIGSIIKGNQPIALIKVDKLVYQVKVGNYLGQNFGRITKITETAVTLREIIQDGSGDWMERMTQLELQERSK
jgi:type IV pilus assembly protein PilP